MNITVRDDVLPDPDGYRKAALDGPFDDFHSGDQVFHGIQGLDPETNEVCQIAAKLSGLKPTLSFYRKSPVEQAEPNYIHSDIDMGKQTAIYYMNPSPALGDGTLFWEIDDSKFGKWEEEEILSAKRKLWGRVDAKFNRMTIFDSHLFHSRALYENYGVGSDSRLIQVVFMS